MKPKELTLDELMLTAIIMLLGREGEDWVYFDSYQDYWNLRLLTRIN